jgi:hypothetical protein
VVCEEAKKCSSKETGFCESKVYSKPKIPYTPLNSLYLQQSSNSSFESQSSMDMDF